MGRSLRSLPINATDRTRALYRLGGRIHDNAVGPDLTALRLEDAAPIREFFAWKGKRNYEGMWWSSTTRTHIGFESLLERQYLLSADHDEHVIGISGQPVALLWPHGTTDNDGRVMRGHVVDFFVRLTSGDGRLVDVRRPDKADTRQFTITREMCEQVGWQYQVFTGLGEIAAQNLAWLGGYRMDRYAPDDNLAHHLTSAFTPATSLGAGIARAARAASAPRSITHAAALNMLFAGQLRADLDQTLTTDTQVRAA